MGVRLKEELLSLLACPKCKGEVEEVEEPAGLVCRRCDLFYPIREDIPVMLLEEAQKYSELKSHESSR